MSFICRACGRQRAGANDWICRECDGTQMGEAGKLLVRFENQRLDQLNIRELEAVLDEAQNSPPEGKSDGSITEPRWNRLAKLVRAARAFNEALREAVPQSHQKDW